MGFFDNLFGGNKGGDTRQGVIGKPGNTYGNNKESGGHDHRTNKGDDRTPRQKEGDKARRK